MQCYHPQHCKVHTRSTIYNKEQWALKTINMLTHNNWEALRITLLSFGFCILQNFLVFSITMTHSITLQFRQTWNKDAAVMNAHLLSPKCFAGWLICEMEFPWKWTNSCRPKESCWDNQKSAKESDISQTLLTANISEKTWFGDNLPQRRLVDPCEARHLVCTGWGYSCKPKERTQWLEDWWPTSHWSSLLPKQRLRPTTRR